jgi:hypothetical protein
VCSIEKVKSIICRDVTPCILLGLSSRILNFGNATTTTTTTVTAAVNYLFLFLSICFVVLLTNYVPINGLVGDAVRIGEV